MGKEKHIFYCKECGYESSRWMGQCPGCRQWNTFVEETVTVGKNPEKNVPLKDRPKPVSLRDVSSAEESRMGTGMEELDRVLGGGIVRGSLVLVGGDPGIGKSTLLLEVCRNLVRQDVKVLYVSGEESGSQIRMRSERLNAFDERIFLLADHDMDNVEQSVEQTGAGVVVIDSIQTMESAEVDSLPGSVTQVREVTARLMKMAKQQNVAVLIVGHVTKEGTVAGPRTLEHMVDCVLYFEGDANGGLRMLRSVKNRFGSTNEVGVFNMTDTGLEEVQNPSQMFLNGRPKNAPGSVVVSTMEGTRAILVEIQALCCESNFNMPRRTTVGLDYNRVNLLIAVLEKRGGIHLSGCDCYVNIAGGMRINDPSADLGILAAIVSSFRDKPVGDETIFIGEVGLAGEIRGVRNIGLRVKEAAKMGYQRCFLPSSNYKKEFEQYGMQIQAVHNLEETLRLI